MPPVLVIGRPVCQLLRRPPKRCRGDGLHAGAPDGMRVECNYLCEPPLRVRLPRVVEKEGERERPELSEPDELNESKDAHPRSMLARRRASLFATGYQDTRHLLGRLDLT